MGSYTATCWTAPPKFLWLGPDPQHPGAASLADGATADGVALEPGEPEVCHDSVRVPGGHRDARRCPVDRRTVAGATGP